MKNTKKPLVSIIIPVFNGAGYIKETIDSVFKSSYRNFEVILVNDGSSDQSKFLCDAFAKKYKRVRFYDFEENRGLGRVLNFAISKAKGKYIARINQDDIMRPYRLKKQVEFLEKNSEIVAVGGYINLFTDTDKNFDLIRFPLTDKEIKNKWMKLSPFSDPTVMYRKTTFNKTSGYSQQMWPADDVHMWYQLGSLGKLANLPVVLTDVRWHEGAGSVRFHGLQMKKTKELHKWASVNIRKPTFSDKVFWFIENSAGVLFTPQINWYAYRILRKIIYFVERKKAKIKPVKTVNRVMIVPIKKILSPA